MHYQASRLHGEDKPLNRTYFDERESDWSTNHKVLYLWFGTCSWQFGPLERKIFYLFWLFSFIGAGLIRNIFDPDKLKTSKNIETLEKYHTPLRQLVQIVILFNLRYSKESDIEEISDDYIVNFMNENNLESFVELFEEKDRQKI